MGVIEIKGNQGVLMSYSQGLVPGIEYSDFALEVDPSMGDVYIIGGYKSPISNFQHAAAARYVAAIYRFSLRKRNRLLQLYRAQSINLFKSFGKLSHFRSNPLAKIVNLESNKI
jgi:hypothetical protein